MAHIVLKRHSVVLTLQAVWLEENRRQARSRTGQPENIWSTVALAQPPRTPLHSAPLHTTQLLSSSFHRLHFISPLLPSVCIEPSQRLITASDSEREAVASDPLMSMNVDPAQRHVDTTKNKYRPAGRWLRVCLGCFSMCLCELSDKYRGCRLKAQPLWW